MSMDGYWTKAVKKIFPENISAYEESWEGKIVHFTISKPLGLLSFTRRQVEDLAALLKTTEVTFTAEPDGRYNRDEGGPGVSVTLHVEQVKFPEAPGG